MEFLKKCITTIWEGFLQNIGVLITAFIVSGGYLIAINKLKEFQATVRSIPSDYFLTPLVLLIVLFAVLLRINKHQEQKLSALTKEPNTGKYASRFVTHLGVWWKIYPDIEYIEDFPYCSCCDPRFKLVQTEWHPDEVYKCSHTNTEYKLYDKIPREREEVLTSLYSAYYKSFPMQFHTLYSSELQRIKQLWPELSEIEISRKLFELEPLSSIPVNEREAILTKHPKPMSALNFVDQHYFSYKKYFKSNHDKEQMP